MWVLVLVVVVVCVCGRGGGGEGGKGGGEGEEGVVVVVVRMGDLTHVSFQYTPVVAPEYGDHVPVDTTPSPAPVCRAPKKKRQPVPVSLAQVPGLVSPTRREHARSQGTGCRPQNPRSQCSKLTKALYPLSSRRRVLLKQTRHRTRDCQSD